MGSFCSLWKFLHRCNLLLFKRTLAVWSLCANKIISLLPNCRGVRYQRPGINLFLETTNEWHAPTPWICLWDLKASEHKCPSFKIARHWKAYGSCWNHRKLSQSFSIELGIGKHTNANEWHAPGSLV